MPTNASETLLCACTLVVVLAAASRREALRAGDIIFAPSDLVRERRVLVQPGDRIVLIEEWPAQTGHREPPLKKPRVIQSEVVASDKQAEFAFEWLPNTTLRALTLAELAHPVGSDMDEHLEKKLVSLLDGALQVHDSPEANGDARKTVRLFKKLVEEVVDEICWDHAIVGADAGRKLRTILSILAQDTRRLAWILEHMFDDGYVANDEVMLGFLTQNSKKRDRYYEFRMHVWNDFAGPRRITHRPSPHDHALSTFASVQIAGHIDHHMYKKGGRRIKTQSFEPVLYRDYETAETAFLRLAKQPMEAAEAIRMDAGMVYVMPPRWIHSVSVPSDQNAVISLELRVNLDKPRCGQVPFGVHLFDQLPPNKLMAVWNMHKDYFYKQLITFFKGGMQDPLKLDGAHLKSVFVSGTRVRFIVDKRELRQAFEQAPKAYRYDSRMDPMLGPHDFEVASVNSDGMVSLREPGDTVSLGPETGPWYFPESTMMPTGNDGGARAGKGANAEL